MTQSVRVTRHPKKFGTLPNYKQCPWILFVLNVEYFQDLCGAALAAEAAAGHQEGIAVASKRDTIDNSIGYIE